MKKSNNALRNLVYVHLNENKQYVLSCGIEFAEFIEALSSLMNQLLLLRHQYDDGDFNMHTLLEFVPNERIIKLAKDDVYSYGDFCWADFEEEESLNDLSGQELAELLYLSHMKDHLRLPFYNKLQNRFVYLAQDDGWWNKTYYRNMKDFYRLLGYVIAEKVVDKKLEKNLLGIKKKRPIPAVNMDLILNMKTLMKEGVLISIRDAVQTRTGIEIPIWVIGDFSNMDDMYEEYEKIAKSKFDAKLVFDKKMREWKMNS